MVVLVVLVVLVVDIVMLTTMVMDDLRYISYAGAARKAVQCMGTDLIIICCRQRCIAMKYFHPKQKYLFSKAKKS